MTTTIGPAPKAALVASALVVLIGFGGCSSTGNSPPPATVTPSVTSTGTNRPAVTPSPSNVLPGQGSTTTTTGFTF